MLVQKLFPVILFNALVPFFSLVSYAKILKRKVCICPTTTLKILFPMMLMVKFTKLTLLGRHCCLKTSDATSSEVAV